MIKEGSERKDIKNAPFSVLSQGEKYFHFMVISSWAGTTRYACTFHAVPPQTRSLPVSTGFSQQHIIIHNNINSYSSNTQNGLLVCVRSNVCLPGCWHLEVDIWLSVCLWIPSLRVCMLKLSLYQQNWTQSVTNDVLQSHFQRKQI